MITVKFYCNDRHLFEERYDSQERRDDEVAVWMKWNEDTAGTEDVHIHHFEEISDEQPDPDPARGSEGE